MHRAGELRLESTPAERKLWAALRGNKVNGVKFRRQHAIWQLHRRLCLNQKETHY